MCAKENDLYEQRGNNLIQKFFYYKVATITLKNVPLEEAAQIFERINSKNMKLTNVDLMQAATWRPEFDLTDSIDAILADLKKKGFSDIDRLVILRNISRAAGHDFQAGSFDALRADSTKKLKKAVRMTQEAYRKAVDFLTTQIRMPGGSALPYSNQLTVLAEIFRRTPNPTHEQFAAIRQWFWRTGAMSADQTAVSAFAAGKVHDIEISAAKPDADIWRQRIFRLTNAHSKLLTIVLSHRQPLDLLTGQPIDVAKALSAANVKEFHHFFPKKYLNDRSERQEKINCLANIIMLTAASNKRISGNAPSDYLKEVKRNAGANLKQWLESNLISIEAYEAAESNNFDKFLDLRAHLIHETVMNNSGWGS